MVPPAYDLALSLRRALRLRYDAVEQAISCTGRKGLLVAFKAAIQKGSASINMTLPDCTRFLRTGVWLNIYEVAANETGKTGEDLEREVASRISKWYAQRRRINELFNFGVDTHYAALNLGGAGAQHYGTCCVVFDLDRWKPFFTCFGGDTIRACFDSTGAQVQDDREILQKFAVGDDRVAVSVVRYLDYLNDDKVGLDLSELRGILEDSESLIELHQHGPVSRDQVLRIVIPRKRGIALRELARRSATVPQPLPQEFDQVPFFLELNRLASLYDIPLYYED